MKKTLIALAAVAASSAALAQSSVTLFGIMDVNVRHTKTEANGTDVSLTEMAQDGTASSRLGFRGVEDLGGGLKASFNFEQGINAESGATDANTWQRNAWVALSGGFGKFQLGRSLNPSFWGVAAWELTGTANYSAVANQFGFAGGPWTVATYMIEGRGSDRSAARTYAYEHAESLDRLLEVLVDATARYLVMQARSGAQALKIFESWAEGLAEDVFERIVIRPHQAIVEKVRAAGVTAPFIGFPRGAGALVDNYARAVPVEAVALDTQASAEQGRRLQAGGKTIQGALDNLLLRAGGPALDARVDGLIAQWGNGPYIFNLGHGVLPDTPISHIARVVERVTGKPVKAMAQA